VQISTNLSYVALLREGNSEVKNPNAGVSNDLCAPGLDSILTLKNRIFTLDNMGLVEGDESESDPTDDEESLV
jgi:hypothetical protein